MLCVVFGSVCACERPRRSLLCISSVSIHPFAWELLRRWEHARLLPQGGRLFKIRPSCNTSGLRAACAACMHVLTLLHTNTARLAALLTALDPAALVLGTLLLVDRCLLSNWHGSCPACICPCANDALAKGLWLRDGRTCHTQAVLKYGIDQRRQSVQLEGQPLRPALLGAAVLGHSAADDATCTPKGDMQAGVGSIRVVVIVQVLSGDWQLWCSC